MTDRLVFGAAPLFAAIVCLSAQTPRTHVDRILVNGNIWTGDPAKPHAEALAVAGDTIAAVGSSAEVKALASADTTVCDEDERGTLTAGKQADFAVLSKDILTVPPSEILTTKVLLTVMAGRDTYNASRVQNVH